jgi:spore coat protein U-like protein
LRKIQRLALISALIGPPAAALTVASSSFQVGATITPGCSVSSGTGGAFGTFNFGSHSGVESGLASAAFVPNGSLALACTPGVALSMTIDGGQNYATVRRMKRADGSDTVPYRLYTSSSLTAGSEILLNQPVSVPYSNSNNITLPLYGAAQLTGFSPAGTYSDQLTVILSW